MKYSVFLLGLMAVISLGSCCMIIINPKKSNKVKVLNSKLVKDGIWVEVDSTLNVEFVKYVKGKKNGREYSVDTSGNYSTGKYINGIKNGWFRAYTSEGVLMYEYFYRNDTIVKQGIYYGPTF